MSTLHTSWGMNHAVQVLRDVTERHVGRPLAIYGAGRHTQELLADPSVQKADIAFVLDDCPSCSDIYGVKVVTPKSVSPESVRTVVVSSNSIEPVLAGRARAWVSSAENPPEIVEIYKNMDAPLPGVVRPGPLPLSYDGSLVLDPDFNEFGIPKGSASPDLDHAVLPPPGLRAGYATNDDTYLKSGMNTNHAIRSLLNDHGINPRDFDSILEWGCSTGRVLRHWTDLVDDVRVWGCDIDAAAIDWCTRHICPPMHVFTSTTQPSLPLPDASFDLVYAISIFTHTPELWDMWMMELRRIIKPGGWLCLTLHDEQTWANCHETPDSFISRACPGLDFSKPMTNAMFSYGRGPWSQVFWHSESWRQRSAIYFDLMTYRPMFLNKQAVALHRRPPGLV